MCIIFATESMIGFTGAGELSAITSTVSPGPLASPGKLGSSLKSAGAPIWHAPLRSLTTIQPEGMESARRGTAKSATQESRAILGGDVFMHVVYKARMAALFVASI